MSESLANELFLQIDAIDFPEAANEPVRVTAQRIQASILAAFAKFLANNAGLLPPKDSVLKMLDTAIDLSFTALKRPLLASIIKPAVKAWILQAAGNLYDSIFVPPAVEV